MHTHTHTRAHTHTHARTHTQPHYIHALAEKRTVHAAWNSQKNAAVYYNWIAGQEDLQKRIYVTVLKTSCIADRETRSVRLQCGTRTLIGWFKVNSVHHRKRELSLWTFFFCTQHLVEDRQQTETALPVCLFVCLFSGQKKYSGLSSFSTFDAAVVMNLRGNLFCTARKKTDWDWRERTSIN